MITVSFIIPVYNEQKRLAKTFRALRELPTSPRLRGAGLPRGIKLTEVIFVNDGSTDKTVARIKYYVSSMKKKKKKYILHNTKYMIRVISYPTNRGKGYAVRKGLAAATGDYALFFDADVSTPLSELAKFVPLMKSLPAGKQGTDVIVGTRKNGKSTIIKHQPIIRELLGQGFTLLTKIMLSTNITDFTCGFKAFSKRARKTLLSQARIDGWGYDAELLFLARKEGLSMQEVPVVWSNDDATRVRLVNAISSTLVELATIVLLHRVQPTAVSLTNFLLLLIGIKPNVR